MGHPVLFYDPTSEPCRAVHWLAVAAGIELTLRDTWLTRGEHRSPELLAVNPGHQVPALRHGELCLGEAAAIMIYLVELHGLAHRWLGESVADRARTHRFLSWHHSNTRRALTLDYLLPVLLMPAYKGEPQPPLAEQEQRRAAGQEALALLEQLLPACGPYLGGTAPSLADLHIAVDLCALDADPDRNQWFKPVPAVRAWLERLREHEAYQVSHAAWNVVAERVRALLAEPDPGPRDPGWVAELCLAQRDGKGATSSEEGSRQP